MKSKLSKRFLTRISQSDAFWNLDDMKLHAEKTFYEMQEAWENRDIDKEKKSISVEFYEKYRLELENMKERNEKNIIRDINLEEIKIIGCEDYKDDCKDKFTAYLSGTILDYTILETTGEVIKNREKTREKFSDTYHFIRNKNKWILDNIDNSVSLKDIVLAKNFKE